MGKTGSAPAALAKAGMRTPRPIRRSIPLMLAVAVVLAGCGEEEPEAARSDGVDPPVLAEIADAAGPAPNLEAPEAHSDDPPAPPDADADADIGADAPEVVEVDAPGSEPSAPNDASGDVQPAADEGPADTDPVDATPSEGDPASAPSPPDPAAPDAAIPDPVAVDTPPDTALLERLAAADLQNGFSRAQRCLPCHALDDAPQEITRTGPSLYAIVDAPVAGADEFDYSAAMAALGEAGATWSNENLDRFLTDPAAALPGTAMTVSAIRDPQDRADLIAYLTAIATEPEEETPISAALEALLARVSEADIAIGETIVAERCGTCHAVLPGEPSPASPNLHDILGRPVAAAEDFAYSQAFVALRATEAIWDYERLDAFLASPAAAVPGTRMGFSGLSDETQRAAAIAFLRTLSESPMPLAANDLIALAGGEPRIGVRLEGLDPLVFRGRQSFGGQSLYNSQCAGCHGFTLAGLPAENAPPLIGEAFAERWFDGTVWDLSEYVRREMAVGSAGLSREEYVEIIAYILEQNGFRSGDDWLETSREILDGMGFYQY